MSRQLHKSESASIHQAAGLVVASDRPLPYPIADAHEVDLRVVERAYEDLAPSADAAMIHDIDNRPLPGRFRIFERGRKVWIDDDGWRIHFEKGADRVAFAENPNAEREPQFDLMAERVLVPIYRLLSEETILALHGSAVVIDDGAWAFIGDSGAGKSTTTRELVRRGARLLADDLTLVDVPAREALPGAPVVRLIEDLDGVEEALDARPLFSRESKHWFRLPDERGCEHPIPLAGVVWLDSEATRADFDMTELRGQEAFQRAMAQCFDLSDPEESWRVRRFKLMARLLRDTSIYRYSYAKSESGEPTHVEPLLTWIDDHTDARGDNR
jgi:hypothetical protein